MVCIPIVGLSQADRKEGQISPRLPQFLLWERTLKKQALAAFLICLRGQADTLKTQQIHKNELTHSSPDLPPY